VAEADVSVGVAGLSQQVPVTAFRGRAAWTGYDLVSGRWYAGPDQVLVPTEFLATTGTAVGDSVTLILGSRQVRARIVGEVFDTHATAASA
jgi:putative ABC transport system permease protein